MKGLSGLDSDVSSLASVSPSVSVLKLPSREYEGMVLLKGSETSVIGESSVVSAGKVYNAFSGEASLLESQVSAFAPVPSTSLVFSGVAQVLSSQDSLRVLLQPRL